MSTSETLYTFTNPTTNMQAIITRRDDGQVAVTHKDLDSGNFLPTINLYPWTMLAEAIAEARKIGGRDALIEA